MYPFMEDKTMRITTKSVQAWMRLLISLFVVLAMLAACAPAAEPTTAPEQPPAEAEQPTEPPAEQPVVDTEPAPVEGEKTITVWGFVWTADWLDAIAPQFEADHPGVKVKWAIRIRPYQDMVLTHARLWGGRP
jgi:ABC-type glycerol-3-phosphate transport system substrate-binding protein